MLGIRVPSHLQSLLESFPPDTGDMKDTDVEVHSNENHLPVLTILHNTNTLESFQAMDSRQTIDDVKSNPRDLFSGVPC